MDTLGWQCFQWAKQVTTINTHLHDFVLICIFQQLLQTYVSTWQQQISELPWLLSSFSTDPEVWKNNNNNKKKSLTPPKASQINTLSPHFTWKYFFLYLLRWQKFLLLSEFSPFLLNVVLYLFIITYIYFFNLIFLNFFFTFLTILEGDTVKYLTVHQ